MTRHPSTFGRGIAAWAIVLLLATPLLPGGTVTAQGVPGMQPLAVPDGIVMRCHAAKMSRSDSLPAGATAWEFEMGRPGFASRDLTVTIDSAGRPLELIEITIKQADGGFLLHGVSARFTPDAGVIGVHYTRGPDTPATPRDSAARSALYARISKPLTPSEQRQATTLATWLSGHRCGRHVKGAAVSQLRPGDGHH